MKPQLRDRITAALGWTTEQTKACSLQQLREMLRVPRPDLAAEVDLEIQGGRVVTTMQRAEYHDTQVDKYGKRRFTLYWTEPRGVFRPEPSNFDGKPVGYRRGQVFHAACAVGAVAWDGRGSPWAGMPGGEP